MAKEKDTDKSKLRDNLTTSNKELQKQVDLIIMRQQELQKHMATLEENISDLELLINSEERKPEPKGQKITAYRNAIRSNLEMLNELHNTYRGYEDVKFRYFKVISDNRYNYDRLIEIQMRTLDEKYQKVDDGNLVGILRDLAERLKNGETSDDSNIKDTRKELKSDPKYKL